jgi:hypothetical protein
MNMNFVGLAIPNLLTDSFPLQVNEAKKLELISIIFTVDQRFKVYSFLFSDVPLFDTAHYTMKLKCVFLQESVDNLT